MSSILIFALAIIVIIASSALIKRGREPQKHDSLIYEPRTQLFSPAERSFFGVLEQAVDTQYRVLGKVRVGDILQPVRGLSQSKRRIAWNWINQKHVDFVICSAENLAIIGVAELDDQSHSLEDRRDRDTFLDEAFAFARIPIVRFSARRAYSLQEVRQKLNETLGIEKRPSQENPPIDSLGTSAEITPQAFLQSAEDLAGGYKPEAAPICPRCSAVMVKRQAAKGPHAGKTFWACSTYPKCRNIVPI